MNLATTSLESLFINKDGCFEYCPSLWTLEEKREIKRKGEQLLKEAQVQNSGSALVNFRQDSEKEDDGLLGKLTDLVPGSECVPCIKDNVEAILACQMDFACLFEK